MAGSASEESGAGRSVEGISSGQRCQSGEALAEWRSSEQVENGTPSTSPPYWDTDDDDDGWPKPSELYGRYTWKIEKFSQISKRELRSNAFEVGGYKWYILIYPQGCDVCNHLSLFLCVANHDKLLPGWSHFAQFTIAVVNKDPKKSKYSDTLHRFWKKEHDWGWKKFMELSKVSDGFKDGDTLIIKAQVQVIREKADRPFRCLDCQYRRELVRVYLSNVEQLCRRFVEERRAKLGRLIEDKARWSSFCAFWLGIDQNARRRMSREKTDSILKVVVKHFFIEKEVSSTLVMDSLYSGLKALEAQSKGKKGGTKMSDVEDMPAPIVHVENDMFVLVDDVLLLLERAALEPLPPKDEKGPQNRTKDVSAGDDLNKDSAERDERRLTELGRRTVEIFVLAHIFSNKIEVAYQEAVALKRQEELIREEEAAAWLAESDQKGKRGGEKEKKSKKKQAKQKRSNRKGKDKKREERPSMSFEDKPQEEILNNEKKEPVLEIGKPMLEKPDMLDDVSEISDSVDGVTEVVQPDSEYRDASPVNWDTDTSEVNPPTEATGSGVCSLSSVPNGTAEKRSPSLVDDSSSTCSTDSVPSVVMNGPYKGNSFTTYHSKKSANRAKSQRAKAANDGRAWANGTDDHVSRLATDVGEHNSVVPESSKFSIESEPEAVVKKEEVSQQKKLTTKKPVDTERPKEKTTAVPSSSRLPQSANQSNQDSKNTITGSSASLAKASSNGKHPADQPAVTTSSQVMKSETQKPVSPNRIEKPLLEQLPMMSRPSSAPLVPAPRPSAPVISMVQPKDPLLARSASAAGRLGPDLSASTHNHIPQSIRNTKMGNPIGSTSSGLNHAVPASTAFPYSVVNPSPAYSQQPTMVSAPMFIPQSSECVEPNPVQSSFPFGMVNRDILQNGHQWMDNPQRDGSRIIHSDPSSLVNDIRNRDLYKPLQNRSQDRFSNEFLACTSGRQSQGALTDGFPHLDIINDLLDDEQSTARTSINGPHSLNRQFSFPCEMDMSADLASSTGSCRFERARSYHDDVVCRGYGSSSSSHFDTIREFIPQGNALHYANGQIEGMTPTAWQMSGSDLSLLGMRNPEGDGYPYFPQDYPNLPHGVNGYTVFRPSNGH